MTLHIAMSFDHMEVNSSNLHHDLGLYEYVIPNNSYTRSAIGQDGALSSDLQATGGNVAQSMLLPKFRVKSPQESPMVVFGGRFGQLDAGTNTKVITVIAGTTPLSSVVPSTVGAGGLVGGYIEIALDRLAGTVDVYRDGIRVGTVGLNQGMIAAIKSATEFSCEIAIKNYTTAIPYSVRDIYALECDDVYPNHRLGSIRVKSTPVVIESVSGVDKSVQDVESVANQKIVSANGSPWEGGNGVVGATSLSGEIGFRLDAGETPTANQIAAAVFVGARRLSSTMVRTSLEQEVNGSMEPIGELDLQPLGAERIKYFKPFAAKSEMGGSESVEGTSFKFKFQGE